MIKEAVDHHAQLMFKNGVVIEGFVTEADEYLRIIEYNNNVIIAKSDDISMVRIFRSAKKENEEPGQLQKENAEQPQDSQNATNLSNMIAVIKNKKYDNEFVMNMDPISGNTKEVQFSKPEFKR